MQDSNSSLYPYDNLVDGALKKSIFPMILAGLIGTLAMLIDSMFVGRFLGTTYMAAYGLISPMLLIVTVAGGILSFGTSMLISSAYAKGEQEKADKAFSRTLIIAIIIFLFILCLVVFFGKEITGILSGKQVDESIRIYMLDYLIGFTPSFLVLLLLELFIHVTDLEGRKGIVYICVLITLIVDVVLDAINVFVWHRGLFGMAIASSISYIIPFIIYILYFIFKSNISFKTRNLEWKSYPDTLKKGIPAGINRLVTAFRTIFLNKILILVATESAVAALSVNNSVMQILLSICNGVGGACTLLAGFLIADHDTSGLNTLLRKSIKYAFIATTVSSVFCVFFATPISLLFTTGEKEIVSEAAISIIFGAIYIPIYTVTYQIYSYLHGIDRKQLSIPLIILQNGTIVVIMAYILGKKLGAYGVWIAFPIAASIVLLITLLSSFVLAKKEGINISQYIFVPGDKYLDENAVYESRINTIESLNEELIQIQEFCMKMTDVSKAKAVSLLVEETVRNIFSHIEGRLSDTVSIRATVYNGEITVRIRDNFEAVNSNDSKKNSTFNVSTTLPGGISADTRYSKVVNINNRIITVKGD